MGIATIDQGQTGNAQQTPSSQSQASGLSGILQKGVDAAKSSVGQGGGPLADKARNFAKQRPAATAALVGVIGLAVLNTLRGR